MRAHLLLPLGVLALSSWSWGATEGPRVRASLSDEADGAAAPPGPRRIRKQLEADAPSATLAVGRAAFPAEAEAPPAPLRRVFRLTLDAEPLPSAGRLIRLSLEDSGAVFGRLSRAGLHGRYVRTSLD